MNADGNFAASRLVLVACNVQYLCIAHTLLMIGLQGWRGEVRFD